MPDTSRSHPSGATPSLPEAAPPTDPGGPLPATQLGPFRLGVLLGEGGMGQVYRAEDIQLGRAVALKVMRPEQASRPESRERFLREARAVAALQHDHVVPIFQVGETDGVAWFAMPLLTGESLERRLQREPRLPLSEVLRIGRETAEGLAAAHAAGLIHRDVKPSNIWLEGPVGRVKILDFGLVRNVHAADELTGSGMLLGSPGYMSPEQVDGLAVDHRTDLFSLGCVLYRLVTGEKAFTGKSLTAILRATVEHQPVPVQQRCPQAPAALAALLGQLLAKKADDRPATADLVAERLRESERLGQTKTTPQRVPAQTIPKGGGSSVFSRRSVPWLLAAGAALLMLGIGLWALQGKGKNDFVESQLKVELRVEHFERQQGRDVPQGPIGGKSMEVLVNDRVVVKAELSSPGYCYVIGFNFDGKEQLLWPRNEKAPDRTIAPPLLERVQCRPLELDDNVRGGLQAYIVVASGQLLPAYQEWERSRAGACPWRYLPARAGVWRSDGEVLDTVHAGEVRVRAKEVELEGQPPLLQLSRWARGGGVTVEAVAFPVYRREKR
jgi:serine/threonine protein kinase